MDIKKRYIIAVSGGIDSVVLLDMALKWPSTEIIVAHFDHGMRDDSAEDTEFVRRLAKKYGLPFETERAELGKTASEEYARRARYGFLRRMAKKYDAQIVTAHHKDDVLETILINLIRGTGWRGLCSLRSGEVYRPLLEMKKAEIEAYAKEHGLTWREDPTNVDEKYLRNYVRHRLLPRIDMSHQEEFFSLYMKQCDILKEITEETDTILGVNRDETGYRRHLFIMVEPMVAKELLYAVIYYEAGKSTMRPQLDQGLLAVKSFRPNTHYQVGSGVELSFSRTHMIVEAPRN